ncbi:MAG: hypothetical protein JNN20_15705 [Betaproteobacteria bacterium]|nr:hypothetical protein [Betaproteobacteria bacterium]
MIILLFVLAMLSLVLLAIPILTIGNGVFLFLTGADVSAPEGHFILACCVWLILAALQFWLYRVFNKEEMSGANVGWFFGIALVCALFVILGAAFVADVLHLTFGEFGMGAFFMLIGAIGVVVAGTFFQLLRVYRSRERYF